MKGVVSLMRYLCCDMGRISVVVNACCVSVGLEGAKLLPVFKVVVIKCGVEA